MKEEIIIQKEFSPIILEKIKESSKWKPNKGYFEQTNWPKMCSKMSTFKVSHFNKRLSKKNSSQKQLKT